MNEVTDISVGRKTLSPRALSVPGGIFGNGFTSRSHQVLFSSRCQCYFGNGLSTLL